jgi:hypothetical protein
MNRKNIDDLRFVDLDEFVALSIVPIQYIDNVNKIVKEAYKVDGVTKNGLSIPELFIDRQSGTDKLCHKFIMDNWVNKK